MMKNLITARQKELLSIIYQYIKDTGYPPSFEEMRERLRVASNQSIIDLLGKLVKQDLIKRQDGARSLVILPLGHELLGEPALTPFLGVSSAGAPIDAVEIEGEWQEMSPEVARLKEDVFLLKISGNSMINAGIDNNDIVLVKNEKNFFHGDIVLAKVGEDSTVKRFMSEDKPPYVYLKPENPAHNIILLDDDARLIGKIISVLKNGYWKPVK